MKACSEGNTLPDLCMERTTGEKISASAVLRASNETVKYNSRK